MGWLLNNLPTILAGLVVIIIALVLIRSKIKEKKQGGCGCGCPGCTGSCPHHADINSKVTHMEEK